MEEIRWVVKPEASRLLKIIGRNLSTSGISAYLVGGAVRDLLLGRNTVDIDIAVEGDARVTARKFAEYFAGTFVTLDEQNGIYRVVLPDSQWHIDFTRLKGDIREDLACRDFTIDAMAFPLEDNGGGFTSGKLIDPFDGREALRRREIKAVSDSIFQADPARLLRAVRLAAELNFDIDPATESIIQRDAALAAGIAGERVREELLRLLSLPGAGENLAHLDRLGILTALIPEIEPLRGVEQPWIHFWDVLTHSIKTISAVEFLLREGPWEYVGQEILDIVPWSVDISTHFDQVISFGSTRRSMLKLAALFHDIAKPQTRTIDEDGRARFLGHPVQGAETTASIMERLRFSNHEIRLMELLVKYHLRPLQMSNEGLPTRRAVYRFFRDTGDAGIDLLYLCMADHLATRGPLLDIEQWRAHAGMTDFVIARHFEAEKSSIPAKIIDGHDIGKIFGLEPGPEIGRLLEAVREARATGEVTNREQALDFIRKLFNNNIIYPQEGPSQGEK